MSQKTVNLRYKTTDLVDAAIYCHAFGMNRLNPPDTAVSKLLKISRDHLADIRASGITEGNFRVMKKLGITLDDIKSEKNVSDKVEEFHMIKNTKITINNTLEKELYNIDPSKLGDVCEEIGNVLRKYAEKPIKEEYEVDVNITYSDGNFDMVSAVENDRELVLETSYVNNEDGTYDVTVAFEEDIINALGLMKEYTFTVASKEVEGSAEWLDDLDIEIYWELCNALADVERNGNYPESVKALYDDVVDNLAYVDWNF